MKPASSGLRLRRVSEEERGQLERLLSALSASKTGAWDWNAADETLRCDARVCLQFGLEPREYCGDSSVLVNRILPSERAAAIESIRECCRRDVPFSTIVRVAASAGEPRSLEISGQAVRGADGEVVRVSGLTRDVTEAQRTGMDLRLHAQLLAEVHESIISTSLDGAIRTWNAGAERLYGYNAADAIGRSLEILCFPEDLEYLQRQMTAVVLSSGAHEFVGRFRHRSGFELSADVRLAVLRNEHGAPKGIVSCSHDVTRKREEEEAFKLQARVLESMGEGVCLTDPDSRIFYTNSACDAMFGYPLGGLVGCSLSSLYASTDDCGELVGWRIEDALKERPDWTGELKYRRPDGRQFISLTTVSVLELANGPTRVWVHQDVTQCKETEAALLESERLFRTMAESAPLKVWMCDRDLRCTYVNQRWLDLVGGSMEESLGAGWLRGLHPVDRERFEQAYNEAWATESDFEVEHRIQRSDGEYRWVLSRAAPRSVTGRLEGYIGSSIDITDRKLDEEHRRDLEHRVLAAQKLESLGVLAGGIAHDFNNLLVSMLGYSEMALADLPPTSPAYDSVTQVEIAARQAADLTNQILAFSGKGHGVVEAVDLSAAIRETLQLLEARLLPQVRLHLQLADDLPHVEADVSQVRQVVLNLALNASDAIGAGRGTIAIRTRFALAADVPRAALLDSSGKPADGYVCLEVEDDGAGMNSATREKIFEPFFSTKFTGRGLGLAAVIGVVRGHRGGIEVDSRSGEGSTFRVFFRAAHTKAPVKIRKKIAAEPHPGARILVVDDDAGVLQVTRDFLARSGFLAHTAADGYEAVRLLRHAPQGFDAVLLDLTMPGLSSQETAEQLRKIRADLPIILLSGYSEREITTRFNGHPHAGFVQKPYTRAALTGKVIAALRAASRENKPEAPGS